MNQTGPRPAPPDKPREFDHFVDEGRIAVGDRERFVRKSPGCGAPAGGDRNPPCAARRFRVDAASVGGPETPIRGFGRPHRGRATRARIRSARIETGKRGHWVKR